MDLINQCEVMWLEQAKSDARKHISLRHQKGRGACNLFILDISESMEGEGIRSLKRGVIDILDEYSKHPELDENVAVIIFGEETKFLHYYSNDYAAIKHSIENLECSGPSPLTAALFLALGGLFNGSAHTQIVGEFLLDARVVVFTDGRLTDFSNENATEQDGYCIPNNLMLAALFSIVRNIGKDHPIYCFPVGNNPDHALLSAISSESFDGRLLEINKARWFGRCSLHYRGADVCCKVTNQSRVGRGVLRNVVETVMSWKSYEEDDLDTIDEILYNKRKILAKQEKKREGPNPNDDNFKEKYSTAPKLGTRVRRGPDWTQDNQDSEGPGTIVGHGDSDGLVYIQWDNGIGSQYGYGYKGIYDVVVCEEPRYPEDGLAAVGCFVRRGPDWKWGDQDGGAGSIGTVYRTMDNATVYVRWPCGRKGNYRFGYDGKFDIDICDPFSPTVIKAVTEQEALQNLGSIENSSNDIKGNFNGVYERKEQIIVQKKDSDGQTTRRINSEENDIETDYGFPDNFTPIGADDEKCGRLNFCSVVISSCSGVEDLSSDNDYPDKHSEGTACECNNVYENNLLVTKNSFPGNINSLFKNNLTSFWHKEYPNSIHENLQDIREETWNTFSRESDNLEMNDSGINRSWQWLDSTGAWIDYPEHVNSLINQRLMQRPNASVVIAYNNQSYRVVPHKLLQINLESKEKHTIRWKIVK
uniref:Uncharacterized protein LOC111128882 n=1 Tax=Crassostrea virginica TaxID=6565 RepID=A0A8B8DRP8_CRAVI|nr:uncharacterized protein LOC111128882 [Crassostrea virginica]